jgi:hypothetical protein
MKTYDGPQRHEKILKLLSVCESLRAKAVQNGDRIDSDDVHGMVVFPEPKGRSDVPKTTRQVLDAISCILHALIVSQLRAHVLMLHSYLLQVMHAEPQLIFHRDIRWPNVVKCADDPRKWILIDWDDAATPPTPAATHFDKRCHPPAVFKDNHGPEVDLWAVGRLIHESARFFSGFPVDLLAVGEAMQSG